MDCKHFSHTHGLIVHQVPSESQITCSGCKFPGTSSVYACWPCSYFLHEQCFHAARSMNHPSHPTHPLTLVPYPTYPSNSFFCNSCNLVGSGLSYSCSSCNFDLHVHCASTPNSVTTHESFPSTISLNYPIPHEQVSQNNPIPMYRPHDYGAMATLVPQMGGMVVDQYQTGQQQCVSYSTGDQVPRNSFFPIEPVPANNHVPIHPSSHYGAFPGFDSHWGGTSATPVVPTPEKPQGYPDPTPVASVPVKPQGYPDKDQTARKKEIKHFSHPHPLRLSEFQEGDSIVCLGCEEDLLGPGYSCITSECDFNLHKSCFKLAREIKHESHIEHPLALLPSPPYKTSELTCDACLKVGSSFAYHCNTCQFDLHVNCASLPKTVKRGDHEHVLVLLYSSPYKKPTKNEEAISFLCDVCNKIVDERCWVYYCKQCDFGTHLECVNTFRNSSQTQSSKAQSSQAQTLESILASHDQLAAQRLEALIAMRHQDFLLSLI
ncbi:hypothetical protein LguiB_011164 [Lonicera macranthoides]